MQERAWKSWQVHGRRGAGAQGCRGTLPRTEVRCGVCQESWDPRAWGPWDRDSPDEEDSVLEKEEEVQGPLIRAESQASWEPGHDREEFPPVRRLL